MTAYYPKDVYLAPEILVTEVAVEHGFSTSMEDPYVKDELDW